MAEQTGKEHYKDFMCIAVIAENDEETADSSRATMPLFHYIIIDLTTGRI